MKRGYEHNFVVVLDLVLYPSFQLPVTVIYKHKYSWTTLNQCEKNVPKKQILAMTYTLLSVTNNSGLSLHRLSLTYKMSSLIGSDFFPSNSKSNVSFFSKRSSSPPLYFYGNKTIFTQNYRKEFLNESQFTSVLSLLSSFEFFFEFWLCFFLLIVSSCRLVFCKEWKKKKKKCGYLFFCSSQLFVSQIVSVLKLWLGPLEWK